MNRHALPEPAPSADAYETYFATGAYDRRYPAPNGNVLRLIRRHLPAGGHVIDYGCGSGRYLLALGERAGVAAGFDVCRAALRRLRQVAAQAGWDGFAVLGPDPDALDCHVAHHGPADVVLCLFGVLSHVEGRAERQRVLRRLAGLMRPASGRLILSVPNRRRRFLRLQREQAGREEIRYVRRFAEGSVELSYRLYDPRSLAAELAAAGFRLERLTAESLLPEAMIANSRLLAALDRMLTPFVPAALGYGLLAVARREEGRYGGGRVRHQGFAHAKRPDPQEGGAPAEPSPPGHEPGQRPTAYADCGTAAAVERDPVSRSVISHAKLPLT